MLSRWLDKNIQKNWEVNKNDSSYSPFHADKAILYLQNPDYSHLLFKNKGWVTVGNFYVKFERWDFEMHAAPKLVPSYGGWVKFRGIPLHAWNMKTFIQIGEACGGFIEVSKKLRVNWILSRLSSRLKIIYVASFQRQSELQMIKGNASRFVRCRRTKENGWFAETLRSMEHLLEKLLWNMMNLTSNLNHFCSVEMRHAQWWI